MQVGLLTKCMSSRRLANCADYVIWLGGNNLLQSGSVYLLYLRQMYFSLRSVLLDANKIVVFDYFKFI